MECTLCHRILEVTNFSYKNEAKKIYYFHCNECRDKFTNNPEIKKNQKEQYERTKKTSLIKCKCGTQYVAFRDYHIRRHLSSQHHMLFIQTKTCT